MIVNLINNITLWPVFDQIKSSKIEPSFSILLSWYMLKNYGQQSKNVEETIGKPFLPSSVRYHRRHSINPPNSHDF